MEGKGVPQDKQQIYLVVGRDDRGNSMPHFELMRGSWTIGGFVGIIHSLCLELFSCLLWHTRSKMVIESGRGRGICFVVRTDEIVSDGAEWLN